MSKLRNKVMLNAYPDSIGENLSDIITLLSMPAFDKAFSLFYVLPTFFNSDLDRGFSIIDYNLNKELVSTKDIEALKALDIQLKFDIVLNHLSVGSPQFKDILLHGDASKYKDFFIDWNEFWKDHGAMNDDDIVIPEKQYLDKLFMRKSGLPILKVLFPDGTERPYWNTFYQKISFKPLKHPEVAAECNISKDAALKICDSINHSLKHSQIIDDEIFENEEQKNKIITLINKNRKYLGQMDVNAKSPLVWEYYNEVLSKLGDYGCSILRLDAFAYLHKEIGCSNFFNKPGTWQYLSTINEIATKNNLTLLPEIHAEYGLHLHDEVANEGYAIYDFFTPGLILHAIEMHTTKALLPWAKEIVAKGYQTVNMLGCHDGIPLLDLRGKEVNGTYYPGLLADAEIEKIMQIILDRGGRVKNLYGADGKKISYYQVNATYYSAIGEDDDKMLLARAIQMFMPGIPQVWYLDIFCGKNDYEAVEKAGADGHKEINRSTLSLDSIRTSLERDVVKKQLELIKLRNTSAAFDGEVIFQESVENRLHITWQNGDNFATLNADLESYKFEIETN